MEAPRKEKTWQRPTLPQSRPCSTIGAVELNFRVRYGNGWDLYAVVTGQSCALSNEVEGNGNPSGCLCEPSVRDAGGDVPLCPLRDSAERREGRSLCPKWAGQATRAISTGQLHTLLCFHLRPIDVVVYDGSLGPKMIGKTGLGGGFPLRCFQRLSCPDVATQHCSWRNNWYTRGPFTPVLSY